MKIVSAFGVCVLCGLLTATAFDTSAPAIRQASYPTASSGQRSAVPETARESSGISDRDDVEARIATIQKALDAARRLLTDEELKTADQIAAYVGRAHEALNRGDLDGARILTAKARALLLNLRERRQQPPGRNPKFQPI